jgi:hypothetical protein
MGRRSQFTDAEWDQIRYDFEVEGLGPAPLEKKYGVKNTALSYRRKRDAWAKRGSLHPEEHHEAVTFGMPPDVSETRDPVSATSNASTPPPDLHHRFDTEKVPYDAEAQARLEALEARNAELEAQLSLAEAEAEKHNPRVDVPDLDTPERYREMIPADVLKAQAEEQLAAENIARHRQGMPSLEWSDAHIERTITEMIERRIRQRTSFVRSNDSMRVLKMVKPNGTLTQVPVEVQINNEAGQQGAAIWKARDKGFKIAWPYRCYRHDCWLLAATNELGEMTLDGYCSTEHRAGDPYLKGNVVPGVSTSMTSSLARPVHDPARANRLLAEQAGMSV